MPPTATIGLGRVSASTCMRGRHNMPRSINQSGRASSCPMPFNSLRRSLRRKLVLSAVAVALGGFALGMTSTALPGVSTGCAKRVQERLFFGLNAPHGEITDAEWDAFVETVVTPRFPAGLTVVEATGQWQTRDKRVSRENSRVLEIIHENSADASRRIAEIASEYKTRYRQESVLIARGRVEVCF